jgi:hypothetical protein
MNWLRAVLSIAVILPPVAACGDDDSGEPATTFSAELSGAEEVPANASTATGSANLEIENDQINYTITTEGLLNPAFAHIHIQVPGQNGPVRLNLCGTGAPQPDCTEGDGILAAGSNGTTVGTPAITFDSLVSALRSGGAYVNVHTDDGVGDQQTGPGDLIMGEIRGQITAD